MTITILVLLATVAIGLLSLSTLTVRSASRNAARAEARANARLALQLAIAELQKTVGDDRRITANGSIIEGGERLHAVGAWESWSPRMTAEPGGRAPNYQGEKQTRFLRWLVSGKEDDLSELDWAKAASSGDADLEMFRESADGFSLQASPLGIEAGAGRGSIAWAVSQEATKAKLSVAGPERDQRVTNDDLQVQPRPATASTEYFGQPEDDWNRRAMRVVGIKQAALDPDLWKGPESTAGGAHFTGTGAGLLTNVVTGGLKTDLNLGFEMSEANFNAPRWASGSRAFKNPFHGDTETAFKIPSSYENQRALYSPLDNRGAWKVQRTFWPANVEYYFPVSSVPTFHSLRSFYRLPYHLYSTDSGLTVFERPIDHVAGEASKVSRGFFPPPSDTVDADKTQVGIRPVMDRVMFLISGGLSSGNELRLVITPVVTLWNPYNVALEIEGSVAHVWIDIPYDFRWRTYGSNGRLASNDYMYVSGLMGKQFNAQDHARSVDPYFYAAMTADGQPLSSSGKVKPIRFEPGEVRVFAPARQELQDYDVSGSIRDRTLFLRPVDSLDQFTTKGGFSVPTKNFVRNQGFVRKLAPNQTAQLTFAAIPGEDYPFYITVEDATRAKGSNPSAAERGKAVVDVLANNFSRSGEVVNFSSPRIPYNKLKREPVPVGVLESYHRVARDGSNAQIADLVYTGNPRQPWMNPFITRTEFKTGPQYQIRMRAVSSFNGVLQSANGGRSAYYGASQTPNGGRTHLSFFEVPSAPLLSLAGFQHGDFSSNPFAPANQVGNSWASAYVPRNRVSEGPLEVDHCYLLNEALWDGWFFSGAAPSLSFRSASGSPDVWNNPPARVSRPMATVLREFLDDPLANPLRNPRMRPVPGAARDPELVDSLLLPEGCLKIAGSLMVDGAFNVNSTSVDAWTAVLSGLRGATFDVEGNPVDVGEVTPFPRFRDPMGTANDKWQGYRTLTDEQVRALATELVEEVRARGPFLSLGE
ncbi:MAG: hypothetical protein HKO57_16625, partial [Akkermansiaceae bacterium]|nr:hypothetical protein [Akkermansiaceae bacterium]